MDMSEPLHHASGMVKPARPAFGRALRHAAFCLGVALVAWAGSVPASVGVDDWTLVKTSDDGAIEIYQHDSEHGFREFRAVTRLRGTLGQIIALFTDVEHMNEWVYRTKEVRRLNVISERELYAYTIIDLPWPLDDRDAVLHIFVDQDPQTYVVTVRIESITDYHPEQAQRVRMPRVKSTWTVAPLEDGYVEVSFQGYGDPGGNLSLPVFRWYVDLTSWEAPLSTLTGLRRQVESGAFRGQRPAYIRERP